MTTRHYPKQMPTPCELATLAVLLAQKREHGRAGLPLAPRTIDPDECFTEALNLIRAAEDFLEEHKQ